MKQISFRDYYTARILETLFDKEWFMPVYASSNSKTYPFQVAATGFALHSPYLKGAALATTSMSINSVLRNAAMDIAAAFRTVPFTVLLNFA